MKTIELLSPAKDLSTGIAAINHGADAVYIGAPRFGARAMASNSIDDIAQLVQYAHLFKAKVYVALNTILYNNEIDSAVEIINQLYEHKVDALIIQDLGLLECDLPPIEIHASTQLNNRTPEKVEFLQNVGFSQVVLARELNLNQIKAISEKTNVKLEFFVHGALCVCYSGQCYMSEFATNRSGNRGECAQMCRHKYSLSGTDINFKNEGYFLSTQDLHLGNYIGKLIDAGISSFKIEGRLKDEIYVKNVTAYFRKIIDTEIANRTDISRSSEGFSKIDFEPDIYKTFSRGFTNYYIDSKRNKIANFVSPKSQGEYLGTVTKSVANKIEISGITKIDNGDGLCYIDQNGDLAGIKVNETNGKNLLLNQNIKLKIGTKIWRNYSIAFEKIVNKSLGNRKILVDVIISETENGYKFEISDSKNTISINRIVVKEKAINGERAIDNIKKQASKFGNSNLEIRNLKINFDEPIFIAASEINEARRIAIQKFTETRLQNYSPNLVKISPTTIPYPTSEPTDFRLNIANDKTKKFFEHHNIPINQQDCCFELNHNGKAPLMTTKFCLRYQLDLCSQTLHRPATPITISDKQHSFRIEFDCSKCEMNIFPTK